MKFVRKIGIGQDGFEYESSVEGVKEIRFSPRSYAHGERLGFMCGIAVGFIAGIMFICFQFGIIQI